MSATSTRHTTLRRRSGAIATLGIAAATALVGAGPAHAEKNDGSPTDKNGKKSCPLIVKETGTTIWVPDGTTITRQFRGGDTQKEQCDDGSWKMVLTRHRTGLAGGISATPVATAATPAPPTVSIRQLRSIIGQTTGTAIGR